MSAISWGFKAAAATVLVMLGLWLLYRVVGLGFAIVIGMLAGFAFAVAVAVVLVRRLIGAGIERFAEILKVGQDERYDRSDEMASEIAAAPSHGGDELREVGSPKRPMASPNRGCPVLWTPSPRPGSGCWLRPSATAAMRGGCGRRLSIGFAMWKR